MGREMENALLEAGGVPLDITGAGMAGDYFNLAKAGRLLVVLVCGAWAGGTAAVTLKQAKTAAGGSAKALAFTKKWERLALTGTAWVEAVVALNTFDLDTANEMHVMEIDQSETDDLFNYVSCQVATPGANADLLAMFYIGDALAYGPRSPALLPDPKT